MMLKLALTLALLTVALADDTPTKPAKCPCKCFVKNSFAVRKQMAKRQCRFPQFSAQCTTFKCNSDDRIGFECCDKFEKSPTPSPSPSASPSPLPECPCTCRQGDRAFRAAKKDCKSAPDNCEIMRCGKNQKWQCC